MRSVGTLRSHTEVLLSSLYRTLPEGRQRRKQNVILHTTTKLEVRVHRFSVCSVSHLLAQNSRAAMYPNVPNPMMTPVALSLK